MKHLSGSDVDVQLDYTIWNKFRQVDQIDQGSEWTRMILANTGRATCSVSRHISALDAFSRTSHGAITVQLAGTAWYRRQRAR